MEKDSKNNLETIAKKYGDGSPEYEKAYVAKAKRIINSPGFAERMNRIVKNVDLGLSNPDPNNTSD